MQKRLIDIFRSLPVGQKICIKGWIQSVRKHKQHVFIDVNDGSCFRSLQLVLNYSILPSKLQFNSIVEANGLFVSAKNQFELHCDKFQILNSHSLIDGYPFLSLSKHNLNYLRQYPHLRFRIKPSNGIFRIRSSVLHAIHDYFLDKDFIHVDIPVLTTANCEGRGNAFIVQSSSHPNVIDERAFFSKPVFLTTSGQLHLECAVSGLSHVYRVGPVFRAEKGLSTLHLAEFHMAEAEIAYLDDSSLLFEMEALIRNIISQVLNSNEEVLHYIWKYSSRNQKDIIHNTLTKNFVILTYKEAAEILLKFQNQLNSSIKMGETLKREHEQFLIQYSNNSPVFITEWPKHLKPFYTKSYENKNVMAVDLFLPGATEVIGGSIRENNSQQLTQNLIESGLNDVLDWYKEQKDFGNIPSGGFGLGVERFLLFLTGITNIRDTIPFPRWPNHCIA